MRLVFSALLHTFCLWGLPAHAGADCVRLLKAQVSVVFGVQAGGPVSEADYITGIEFIFDKLAESGVDFAKFEAILKADWLVEGGSLSPEKIRPAFSKQTRLISFTAEVFTRLERDLSARPELGAKIRAHVFESLQNRMTSDARARAGVRERVQERRVVHPRFEPTSLDFTFEPVDHPTMGRSVKDPSGMTWSEVLTGSCENRGTVINGIVTDSDAVKACEKIGGRLPTKEDYERLRTYFERNKSEQMTTRGLRDFHRVFPDMKGMSFWSSSVYLYDSFSVLYGDDGALYSGHRRGNFIYSAVRCVHLP